MRRDIALWPVRLRPARAASHRRTRQPRCGRN